MNQAPSGFKISAYLQDLALQVGQEFPFQQASEWLSKLAKIDLNAKQIERLTHHYGQDLEAHPLPAVSEPEGLHYSMMDGAMILTGPAQWREMKAGRIVKATDIEALSKKRNQINDSLYVAHLGDCEAFFEKFARHTDGLAHKVFLGDGAQFPVGECIIPLLLTWPTKYSWAMVPNGFGIKSVNAIREASKFWIIIIFGKDIAGLLPCILLIRLKEQPGWKTSKDVFFLIK